MFTPDEIAEMQGLSESAMPDTFRVSVRAAGDWVSDGMGGGYFSSAPAAVDYPCRLGPLGEGPQERTLADQLQEVGLMVLHLPLSAVAVGLHTVGTYVNARTGQERAYAVRALPDRSYATERRLIVAPASNTAERA